MRIVGRGARSRPPRSANQLSRLELPAEPSSTEEFRDLACNPVGVGADIGLPDAHNSPPEPLERPRYATVAGSVTADLRNPITRVRAFRELGAASTPVSPMPEVAIAEHR